MLSPGRLLLAITVWALAFEGAGASSSVTDVSQVDISKVPACGLTCIVREVTKSPCPMTDFDCICGNHTLAVVTEACLREQCTVRQALAVAKVSKKMCGFEPHDKSLMVWLGPVIVVMLSTTCYALRIMQKTRCSGRGVDAGDYILGACVLGTAPFLWTAFAMKDEGLGKDMWNIPADNITDILRLFFVDEVLYLSILPMTRITLLLFYLDIFPGQWMKRANYALMGLNLGYMVTFFFLTVFQCWPVQGAWHFWDGQYPTKCNDIKFQGWISAGLNIGLDLAVIILPLPELSKLRISMRKKVHLLVMFSLGFLITIVSIIRLRTLIVFANTNNLTYDYVEPGLMSIFEAALGIICACLPAIRALLSTLIPAAFGTTRGASKPQTGESKVSRSAFSRLQSAGGPTPEPGAVADAGHTVAGGAPRTQLDPKKRHAAGATVLELVTIDPARGDQGRGQGRGQAQGQGQAQAQAHADGPSPHLQPGTAW